jgi:hypothetical protein
MVKVNTLQEGVDLRLIVILILAVKEDAQAETREIVGASLAG